jgi:hypothetical protein
MKSTYPSTKRVLDFMLNRGPVYQPDPFRERLDLVETLPEGSARN